MKKTKPVTISDPWQCGTCGVWMNAASPLFDSDHKVPAEGDFSLCLKCAELHVRHGDKWVNITDDELIALPLEAKKALSLVQHGIREFHKLRKGKNDE